MKDWDGGDFDVAVFACRPVRFEDHPEDVQRTYRDAFAEVGEDLLVYPGSTVMPCARCGNDLWVGPEIQKMIAKMESENKQFVVMCIHEAATEAYMHERAGGPEVSMAELGNPFKRQ